MCHPQIPAAENRHPRISSVVTLVVGLLPVQSLTSILTPALSGTALFLLLANYRRWRCGVTCISRAAHDLAGLRDPCGLCSVAVRLPTGAYDAFLPAIRDDGEEAVLWLLQKARPVSGLNGFSRVLVALDLEHFFKERALANQRMGGEMKGSSNLTEANRVNVRREIAAAAGVSVGNVTKVKRLILDPHPDMLEALRSGEIRIHKAWQWSKESPSEQLKALKQYRIERGVKSTIRSLISKHSSGETVALGLKHMHLGFTALMADSRSKAFMDQFELLLWQIDNEFSKGESSSNAN